MRSQMIQGELDRPFQMFIDTALLFIGKGDDFIQKAGISCLGNIFIDCREQPKGIVCPVCGMSRSLYIGRIVRSIFMSRVMGELYKRKSSPLFTWADSMKRIFSAAISGERWMIPWISCTVSR